MSDKQDNRLLWERAVAELTQKQLAQLVRLWAFRDTDKQAQIYKAMADQTEFGE